MATTIDIKDKKLRKFIKKMIGNAKKFDSASKEYIVTISAQVFRDITKHFEDAPGGKTGGSVGNRTWAAWSDMYTTHMERIGKGGNKLLQDTGRLKQGLTPTNFRKASDGILFFNPVNYAAVHDEGSVKRHIPARPFMWLSDGAMEDIAGITLNFMLKN